MITVEWEASGFIPMLDGAGDGSLPLVAAPVSTEPRSGSRDSSSSSSLSSGIIPGGMVRSFAIPRKLPIADVTVSKFQSLWNVPFASHTPLLRTVA
jgi:hypothetical protein